MQAKRKGCEFFCVDLFLFHIQTHEEFWNCCEDALRMRTKALLLYLTHILGFFWGGGVNGKETKLLDGLYTSYAQVSFDEAFCFAL